MLWNLLNYFPAAPFLIFNKSASMGTSWGGFQTSRIWPCWCVGVIKIWKHRSDRNVCVPCIQKKELWNLPRIAWAFGRSWDVLGRFDHPSTGPCRKSLSSKLHGHISCPLPRRRSDGFQVLIGRHSNMEGASLWRHIPVMSGAKIW